MRKNNLENVLDYSVHRSIEKRNGERAAGDFLAAFPVCRQEACRKD